MLCLTPGITAIDIPPHNSADPVAGASLAGLSLLFAPGARPSAGDIARVAAPGPGGFVVAHLPDARAGLIELLAGGLAFDLAGLAPGAAGPIVTVGHRHGFADDAVAAPTEAIALCAGAHLRGGENLWPVVRIMLGLAARLATLPGVMAIAWSPARCEIEPAVFTCAIATWLAEGAFPADTLIAITPQKGGCLATEGLAFFTGQELCIARAIGETSAETERLLIWCVAKLAENGAITAARAIAGPDGQTLRLDPSEDQRLLRIAR